MCVLKGSPWILKNHTLSEIVPQEIKQESEPPGNILSKYSNSSSEKQDCIVVVDKLQSPRKFKSSTDIRKEIKKFPEINPKLSYSLPKGGIAINSLFEFSFRSGNIPPEWKTADVKFLRKAGKKNYNIASAYRPISLTSFMFLK